MKTALWQEYGERAFKMGEHRWMCAAAFIGAIFDKMDHIELSAMSSHLACHQLTSCWACPMATDTRSYR